MQLFCQMNMSMRVAVLGLLFFFCLQVGHAQSHTYLKAAIQSTGVILVSGSAIDARTSAEDFLLRTASGSGIEIRSVLPRRANEILLVPQYALDPARLYSLFLLPDSSATFVRRDDWFMSLYSQKRLGAVIAPDRSKTVFRLFAPRASNVMLHLYVSALQSKDHPEKSIALSRDVDGVWEVTQPGDHHGVFYTYTIFGPDEPGNYFYDTHPVHITDPYALVSDDSFGKAMVYNPTPPPRPLKNGRPAMEDVIAYEVHVQDFSDELPVAERLKGTFSGMITPGLVNGNGVPIGFDHLLALGINVVHLMPVQEFLHFPDDEWKKAFSEDAYMIEQGISEENYQWGYRTTHAFAVESRYRTGGSAIGSERAQFKELVQAFHDHDIAVIIDVVPNHTGENMDGRHYLFNFNAIDKAYYYRTDDSLRHIGPFGNEIKSEDRPMVQRWILDQLRHWVDVLGVDGFRIDLAGQIDKQTLIWLKNKLPEDLIIYGEAWIAPSDPEVASDPDLGWYKVDAPITFFQDDARNAFKGPVSNPTNRKTDRGFAGGDGSQRDRVMLALTNSFPGEGDPNRGINYLDIHDNWTLADRFSDAGWDGRKHVDEAQVRIAATLLFTSLGPVVIHGGSEMMRSKAHAPLQELVKQTETGNIYLHGKRDTYNLRKANTFNWQNSGAHPTDYRPMDYDAMTRFWSGLVKLRSSTDGDVFTIGGTVPANHFKWILPESNQLLGYVVGERVLVLINTSGEQADFSVTSLPSGSWKQVSDGSVIHPKGCACPADFDTGIDTLSIPGKTARIWIRKQHGL